MKIEHKNHQKRTTITSGKMRGRQHDVVQVGTNDDSHEKKTRRKCALEFLRT